MLMISMTDSDSGLTDGELTKNSAIYIPNAISADLFINNPLSET